MNDHAGIIAGVSLLMFIFIAVGIATTVLWIWAIVDCATRKFKDDTTKIVWILVILFAHILGSLLYVLFGKSTGYKPSRNMDTNESPR